MMSRRPAPALALTALCCVLALAGCRKRRHTADLAEGVASAAWVGVVLEKDEETQGSCAVGVEEARGDGERLRWLYRGDAARGAWFDSRAGLVWLRLPADQGGVDLAYVDVRAPGPEPEPVVVARGLTEQTRRVVLSLDDTRCPPLRPWLGAADAPAVSPYPHERLVVDPRAGVVRMDAFEPGTSPPRCKVAHPRLGQPTSALAGLAERILDPAPRPVTLERKEPELWLAKLGDGGLHVAVSARCGPDCHDQIVCRWQVGLERDVGGGLEPIATDALGVAMTPQGDGWSRDYSGFVEICTVDDGCQRHWQRRWLGWTQPGVVVPLHPRPTAPPVAPEELGEAPAAGATEATARLQ